MNRIDRALAEATLLPVTSEMLAETRELAAERLESGEVKSMAAALTSAARTVASRHESMPGPILVALGREGGT